MWDSMILPHPYQHSVLSNYQSPNIVDIGILALFDTFKDLFVMVIVPLFLSSIFKDFWSSASVLSWKFNP